MRYIILIMVIIIIIIIGLCVSSNDIGDFEVMYYNGAKAYKSIIEKGIGLWVSKGVGGILLRFKLINEPTENHHAYEVNTTISLNEPLFRNQNSYIQMLIIAHEVGHALGIGHWSLSQPIYNNVYYLGNKYPKTQEAYINQVRPKTGGLIPGPPLAGVGLGSGSALVHWNQDKKYGLQNDLMVPTMTSKTHVISIVDLMYLHETGHKVDLNSAQDSNDSYYGVLMDYLYNGSVPNGCRNCNQES